MSMSRTQACGADTDLLSRCDCLHLQGHLLLLARISNFFAAAALCLGVVILGVTGFSPSDASDRAEELDPSPPSLPPLEPPASLPSSESLRFLRAGMPTLPPRLPLPPRLFFGLMPTPSGIFCNSATTAVVRPPTSINSIVAGLPLGCESAATLVTNKMNAPMPYSLCLSA